VRLPGELAPVPQEEIRALLQSPLDRLAGLHSYGHNVSALGDFLNVGRNVLSQGVVHGDKEAPRCVDHRQDDAADRVPGTSECVYVGSEVQFDRGIQSIAQGLIRGPI
ncbi:hypothetical protein CCUS01_16162, partial [Colletotrichum cuscutae]